MAKVIRISDGMTEEEIRRAIEPNYILGDPAWEREWEMTDKLADALVKIWSGEAESVELSPEVTKWLFSPEIGGKDDD